MYFLDQELIRFRIGTHFVFVATLFNNKAVPRDVDAAVNFDHIEFYNIVRAVPCHSTAFLLVFVCRLQ